MKKESITRTIDVEIGGVALRLKSTHDEATVRELVHYVDDKIKEALPLTKNNSVQTAALLACLNVSEELILLKRNAQVELDKVEAKAKKVLTQLEESQTTRGGLDH